MDKAYVQRVREQHGWGVNPWTTFPRFLISHRLLIDDFCVEPRRVGMESLRRERRRIGSPRQAPARRKNLQKI